MQAIAHGGARTPNEILHWKLTLGRKSISAAMENQTCVSGMTVWCPTSWPTVRKHHCHCPAMWCHFVTGPCHVVVSSLHDVTLIWRHSYFIIHHSFLDLAGFCFWLWQTALIHSVPVGGMYYIYNLFSSIIVVWKSRVLWKFRNDCQIESSLVCTSTDGSSDSYFWFSSIFHLPIHSTINISNSLNWFLLY